MNRVLGFLVLGFGLLALPTLPTLADEPTLYLVRHAEKQADSDPDLTDAGHARAQALAKILESVDVGKIYSTDTKRTRQTAAPTAAQKGLSVEIYNPRAFRDYAETLKQEFLAGDTSILVVGHSNTTPYLATLLSGTEYPMLSEDQYDHLYLLRRRDDGSLAVTIEKFNP